MVLVMVGCPQGALLLGTEVLFVTSSGTEFCFAFVSVVSYNFHCFSGLPERGGWVLRVQRFWDFAVCSAINLQNCPWDAALAVLSNMSGTHSVRRGQAPAVFP